jgi:outer membrane protein
MKKLLLVLIITLPTMGFSQDSPKTGYTNIEYILSKIPDSKKVGDALEERRKEYEKAIADKNKELQEKLAIYQKGAKDMPEIIKKDKEKELENLQAGLQSFQQSAETDLGTLQNNLVQPLYIKVYKAIQDFAEENKYQFIFNTGNANQMRHLLVAPENGDISEQIIKKLEAQSKSETQAAKSKEPAKTTPNGPAVKTDGKAKTTAKTTPKAAPAKKVTAKKKK